MSLLLLCLFMGLVDFQRVVWGQQLGIDQPFLQKLINPQQVGPQLQQPIEPIGSVQSYASAIASWPNPETTHNQYSPSFVPMAPHPDYFPSIGKPEPPTESKAIGILSMEEVGRVIPDVFSIIRETVHLISDILGYKFEDRRHRLFQIAHFANILVDDVQVLLLKLFHNVGYWIQSVTNIPVVREVWGLSYYPRIIALAVIQFPYTVFGWLIERVKNILGDTDQSNKITF